MPNFDDHNPCNTDRCEVCGDSSLDLYGCNLCGRLFCPACNSDDADLCIECFEKEASDAEKGKQNG